MIVSLVHMGLITLITLITLMLVITHGLRNEITALQESVSPAGLFTPLIWSQSWEGAAFPERDECNEAWAGGTSLKSAAHRATCGRVELCTSAAGDGAC